MDRPWKQLSRTSTLPLGRVLTVFAIVLVVGTAHHAAAARPSAGDLVDSIVAAPVTPDGAVAGRATDLVVNLAASPDPTVAGRSLLAGKQIRIELPRELRPAEPPLPFLPPGTGCPLPPAGTPLGSCNLVVLLHGWPQRPILPFTAISSSYDAATSTITVTATQDIVAAPPAAPGIKQIHLLLSGFRNPNPGVYELRIEAETGPGGSLETGSGTVHIVPHSRPTVAFTSVFNAGRPSPIFQTASPRQEIVPYDLLLSNRDGDPFKGVSLARVNETHYLLLEQGHAVGRVTIDAPPGANGQSLTGDDPSFQITAPVTGVPTARLTVRFRAGSAPGDYLLRFSLDGGNEIASFVRVG